MIFNSNLFCWAAQRRKEREASIEAEPKKSKILSYQDDEDGQSVEESPRKFENKKKDKDR